MIRIHALYEINTAVWLRELSRRHQREINLANVPSAEIEALADWGFDAVWLMGVWQRGEATRVSALNYIEEYRQVLPDVSQEDVIGSAYAIHAYEVEAAFGGREGLARFRERLRDVGIKLILDFVPNHVATDNVWIRRHPEFFISGTMREAEAAPGDFFLAATEAGAGAVVAHGRDPYFPAWIDTAQLNAFSPRLRHALIDSLVDVGEQCDGVRCDMAMLLMNDIFAATWGKRAGEAPVVDFWREIIPAVRRVHPALLFIAEAYWGREAELQAQGFDYTYDKDFYDQVLSGSCGAIKSKLEAGYASLVKDLRFIENHDEARAADALGEDRGRAAAVLMCALPGIALLHQGQMEGRQVKLPVQIRRGPDEAVNRLLGDFYRDLLRETQHEIYRAGAWRSVSAKSVQADADDAKCLIVQSWALRGEKRLVAVNLTDRWARCRVDMVPLGFEGGEALRLVEVLGGTTRLTRAVDWRDGWLTLEVPPQCGQIFQVSVA